MDTETEQLLRFTKGHRLRAAAAIVLWLLAAFLLVQTINAVKEFRFIGGGVPVSNVISVNGEGEVFAVPDIATFSFSVIEERDTANAAQDAAAAKINRVLEFVRGEGVEEEDIKTTSFNLYPRYEFKRKVSVNENLLPPERERVLVGFEVNQTVVVKVRDTKKAGALIAGVGELGVSNISGLQFTIDDEEDLMREARSLAIEDAKQKAHELAKDLGVSLMRVVSFSEYGSPIYAQRFDVAESAIALGVGGGAVPELPTGENRIVSTVTITYEIR